jgi:hypothetical protein
VKARRIAEMKKRKKEEAVLQGKNDVVVGFAEKAADGPALPAGWAAAQDGDGDTYYVRRRALTCPLFLRDLTRALAPAAQWNKETGVTQWEVPTA